MLPFHMPLCSGVWCSMTLPALPSSTGEVSGALINVVAHVLDLRFLTAPPQAGQMALFSSCKTPLTQALVLVGTELPQFVQFSSYKYIISKNFNICKMSFSLLVIKTCNSHFAIFAQKLFLVESALRDILQICFSKQP